MALADDVEAERARRAHFEERLRGSEPRAEAERREGISEFLTYVKSREIPPSEFVVVESTFGVLGDRHQARGTLRGWGPISGFVMGQDSISNPDYVISVDGEVIAIYATRTYLGEKAPGWIRRAGTHHAKWSRGGFLAPHENAVNINIALRAAPGYLASLP